LAPTLPYHPDRVMQATYRSATFKPMTATVVGARDPAVSTAQVREDIKGFSKSWWLFLITGIAWIFVGMFVLQFDIDSVFTISLIVGIVMFVAAVNEGVAVFTMEGWKWVHALLALLFVFGGVWALAYPGQTFGTLALLLGWFLLAKGTFDVVAALCNRDADLWWLTLICGIVQIAIAFWAIGYPGRSAWLLVVWVGISALMHGFSEIALAFQVRSLGREMGV
jgi:uncharacterized membrane protein HdeD (DUF308 family)